MGLFMAVLARPPSSERPLPAHLMQLCSAVGATQILGTLMGIKMTISCNILYYIIYIYMYIIPRLLLLSLGFPLLFFDCRHFLEFQFFFFQFVTVQRDSYEQQFRGFRIRYFFEKSRETIYIYIY